MATFVLVHGSWAGSVACARRYRSASERILHAPPCAALAPVAAKPVSSPHSAARRWLVSRSKEVS